MSKQGIQRAAEVFAYVQQARMELMAMGAPRTTTGNPLNTGEKQDILLGQMLSRMNDAVKDDFCRITSESP